VRCPRCGARSFGASWYCRQCGSAIGDGARANRAPRGRRALAAAALTLAVVAGLGALAGRLTRPDAPVELAAERTRQVRPETPWPTPSPVPARETEPTATTAPSAGVDLGRGGFAGIPVPVGPEPADAAGAPVLQPPDARALPSPYPGLTRGGAPIWQAAHLARPVVVDGDLGEWASDAMDIAAVAFGAEHWNGAADLSARAFLAYDDQSLFAGASVTDDVFSQPSSGDQLHLGDGLELQLDTDLAGDFAAQSYSADDWQIGLSPGDFGGRAPEAHVWRPEGKAGSGIRVAARRTGFGWVLEAAVPWSLLDVDVSSTSRLGIAFNVGDNDLPAPAQLTMLSSVPARSWGDPRSFGALILSTKTP
jgi:hypothetical protein